jgi:hypothetical protein
MKRKKREEEEKEFQQIVLLEMVERVSNVTLQWRLMNFFREFSQLKHILFLSQRVNFWCLANPCPLEPMSTPSTSC